MKVVIDTNSIVRDYRLEGSAFRILLEEQSLGGNYELNVPAVVIDETTNKLAESLRDAISGAKKSVARLKRLTGKPVVAEFDMDVEQITVEYRAFLLRTVEESGGQILPYPEIPHTELVRRELLRKKPFSSKGTGYRDALIWNTVASLMQTDGEEVAFISENTSDFANEGKLHADLVDDVRAQGIDPERLLFFPSLQDFIDQRIKPHLEVFHEAQEAFEKGDYPFDLDDIIGLAIQEKYAGVEWEPEEIGAPVEFQSSHMASVQHVSNIQIHSVRRASVAHVLVELEADVDVEFDVYINKSDLPVLDESEMPYITDWNWNKYVVEGSATFPLRAALDLVYEIDGNLIASTEVKFLEPRTDESDL